MTAAQASSRQARGRTILRRYDADALPALVALWNRAFDQRRNFMPLTAAAFHARVAASPAFDADGLILAWHYPDQAGGAAADPTLVGFVHAFEPLPDVGQYRKWDAPHQIALLYVAPTHRGQGIGGRLLQAAENWLYYCPVHVGCDAQPCYGTLEGPRPPFFGSSERLTIAAGSADAGGSADETALLRFLARRGYAVHDAGDVSMSVALDQPYTSAHSTTLPQEHGLRVLAIDNAHPFTGTEPPGRQEYSLWGDNDGHPYAGRVYVDETGLLRGHISWYPAASARTVALSHFWLAPSLRGQGLGSHLLDLGLQAMSQVAPVQIELHTHLVHHAQAVTLYQHRGFQIDGAWVKLVKT